MRTTDIIVVGGGLIGCAIARALAAEGATVTLLERDALGSGTSKDAAGMLAPQAEVEAGGPFLDLCVESRRMYPEFAEELFVETGVDVRYRDDGSFHVAFDDAEAARLVAAAELQRSLGFEAEIVDADEARRVEPALAPGVVSVLSVPGDHQVDNRRLVSALAASCASRGVRVIERSDVVALERDASTGRVTGARMADNLTLHADAIVVAAGCWSGAIEGFDVPIEPVKGQMLALDLAAPPFARVLRSERCYLVARIDGRVLVGSTMERVGFEPSVSARVVGHLLESGREVAPSLGAALGGEAWAGFRPATPDGLPALGWVEDGLFAATGHFRNGVLLTPATARLVADALAGRPAHPAMELLDPRRFAARARVPE